jgi:regulator of chromosome condensation
LALTKEGRVVTFGAATYGMLGRSGLDVGKASENYPVPHEVDGLADCKVGTWVYWDEQWHRPSSGFRG